MKINLGQKYKLYPNKSQREMLEHHMFIDNQVRNICINLDKSRYEKNKELPESERTYLSTMDRYYAVKKILSERQLPFKTTVVLTQIRNYENDLRKFFKNRRNGGDKGFLKFHSAEMHKHFSINNQAFKIIDIDSKWSYVQVFKEKIKFRRHRDLKGRVLSASFTMNSVGEYFVSFCIEFETDIKSNKNGKSIGVDLNIHNIAFSDDNVISTEFQSKYSKRFKRIQQGVSRKVKKSKNRKKQQLKLNKLHLRASNKTKDFSHKVTSDLTKGYELIACEDLKVKNMMSKGQTFLNRSIGQISWYQFLSFLEYKAKLNGAKVVKVNPAYTSKTCSCCGSIKDSLELSDRIYECESCGLSIDRDINAAKNILYRAGTAPNCSCKSKTSSLEDGFSGEKPLVL